LIIVAKAWKERIFGATVDAVNTRTGTWATASITLLSAALGTVAGVATTDGRIRTANLWILTVMLILGLFAGGMALACRRRSIKMRARGTAYLFVERRKDWQDFDTKRTKKVLRGEFSRLIDVSGERFDRNWDWPTDDRAAEWSQHLDRLVDRFRILTTDDTTDTGNVIYGIADWPIGLALGGRLRAQSRANEFAVGQRPSRGGQGGRSSDDWWKSAPLEFVPGHSDVSAYDRPARPVQIECPSGTADPKIPVVLLLVRLTSTADWLKVPLDDDQRSMPRVTIVDQSGVGVLPTTSTAILREFRRLPAAGRNHEWESEVGLVQAVSTWIAERAEEYRGQTLLFAGLMTPDAPLGLGQVAADPRFAGWPTNLWPVLAWGKTPVPDQAVIPGLNLGTSYLLSDVST